MSGNDAVKPEAGSVTRMIHDLRSDDPRARDAAARLVWERYFHQLLHVARRQMGPRLRARVDEEDILQSVYESICRRQQRGDFDLPGRDDLWSLLVTVTLRKARNAGRWHSRAKRDLKRELHERESGTAPLEHSQAAISPTPDEALAMAEAFEQRINALPDEALRTVALRKLEGYTNREIAEQLGCAERSIERKLNLIRQIWEGEAS